MGMPDCPFLCAGRERWPLQNNTGILVFGDNPGGNSVGVVNFAELSGQ